MDLKALKHFLSDTLIHLPELVQALKAKYRPNLEQIATESISTVLYTLTYKKS